MAASSILLIHAVSASLSVLDHHFLSIGESHLRTLIMTCRAWQDGAAGVRVWGGGSGGEGVVLTLPSSSSAPSSSSSDTSSFSKAPKRATTYWAAFSSSSSLASCLEGRRGRKQPMRLLFFSSPGPPGWASLKQACREAHSQPSCPCGQPSTAGCAAAKHSPDQQQALWSAYIPVQMGSRGRGGVDRGA